jgi:hypothetical protein
MAEHNMSVVWSCEAVGFSRSSFYRAGALLGERDGPVVEALNAVG